jgi:hypothetical protein
MDSYQLHRMQPPADPRAPDVLSEISVIALLVLLSCFVVLA